VSDPAKLVVLSSAVPGRDAEYARWYEDVHMDEVLAVRGVVTAERHVLAAGQLPAAYTPTCPFAQVGLYDVAADPATTGAEIIRRFEDGSFRMTDAMGASQGWFFTPRTARLGAPPDDADGALLIFSRAAGGEDAAYHRWYDETHLGEVLAVPEITAAQRFTRAPGPFPERFATPSPQAELAIYSFTGPAARAAAALEDGLTRGTFDMSGPIDLTTLSVWFFAAATGRRTAAA
jgi:hypothetical protein